MAMEALLTDGFAHVGAGIALSLIDFFTYKVANPKDSRLQQKKQCLGAIEVLLDSERAQKPDEQPSSSSHDEHTVEEVHIVSKDSIHYAEHVHVVRDYLRSSGIVKLKLPFVERMKDGIKSLIFHEKINGLSNLQKLGVAVGVEVLYDTVFGFYYYTAVLKKSPVAAIAVNLYQIPAFWLGLWLGNGLKKFLDIMITPGDEKKLDKTIRQLLKQTDIVEIIMNYTPSDDVQHRLAEQGIEMYASQLTRLGQGAFTHLKQLAETAKETADTVMKYPEKQEEKREQEQEGRKKRFDELTKGH